MVVSKGPSDIITDGETTLTCDEPCSLRRAGGQGDVMAGTTAAFVGWVQLQARKQQRPANDVAGMNPNLLSAYCGSLLMRKASARAFTQKQRAMLAGDIIEEVPAAFRETFESEIWSVV